MSFRETVLNEGSVSELDMVSVERKDSGLYSCRASNSFGSDETSVQLVVQGLSLPHSPFSYDLRQHTHTSSACLSPILLFVSIRTPVLIFPSTLCAIAGRAGGACTQSHTHRARTMVRKEKGAGSGWETRASKQTFCHTVIAFAVESATQ